ncbi:hypothetical protein P775_03925 [Puniceibacterium antarcticum]|uniref:CMP/dCMP-type deaminase domain-containing protein n=1 Tax=Puniceibacterium antarcticum TaxID=1206336 RepID=A0A2G8RJ42_9RHOB|nr:nucleoside deaminase [Puniceibacterium antarcticum]PIL21522.1 hypothetical protein P775_03925 [Puniceibacterium antarcticum]
MLLRAIKISAGARDIPGTEPFGAIIVKAGKIVGEGINRSVMNHVTTSHGETEAIRDACRNLRTVDLRRCALYSSCEPFALCVAAMNIAGFAALYYTADMDQAGTAIAELSEAAQSQNGSCPQSSSWTQSPRPSCMTGLALPARGSDHAPARPRPQ